MPVTTTEDPAGKAGDIQTVFEHAQRLARPMEAPAGHYGPPVVLVPRGYQAQLMQQWRPTVDDRIRQVVHLQDLASFAAYWKRYQDGRSVLFAHSTLEEVVLRAVLDYHQPDATPESCAHRASFQPVLSVEWRRWLGINKKPLSQGEFAQFVEDNMLDVAHPPGGDLLKILNDFEVNGTVNYQRVQRLTNGTVKLTFQNEQQARSGDVAVPENFLLSLPLWEGGAPVRLSARLRYRLGASGDLKLWFELVNPHRVVAAAIGALIEEAGTLCGRSVLRGAPLAYSD